MSITEALLSSRDPVLADVQNREAGKRKHDGMILDMVEQATQCSNRGPLQWQSSSVDEHPWESAAWLQNNGVVPKFPAKSSIRTTLTRVMRSRQPITAAYSFVDCRSRGQTILYVTVDIASPQWRALVTRSTRCSFKRLWMGNNRAAANLV